MMNFEVEKKARLKNPSAAERKLAKIGKFAGQWTKDDRYYLIRPKAKNKIDMKKDPIFRIRVEKGQCRITAKKRSFRGKTEINEEVEIDTGDPEETLWFFEKYLGLKPFVRKQKRTKLYLVDDMKVEINHVKTLGCFLEVEIQKAKLGKRQLDRITRRINSIFKLLGIGEKDIEPRYYIQLLLKR